MPSYRHLLALLVLGACTHVLAAETIGLYADVESPDGPIRFAVGDLRKALEAKGFTVDLHALAALAAGDTSRRVVIGLADHPALANGLAAAGGSLPTGLGEQAFALQTTTKPQPTHWIIAGEPRGAMYGGLELAESIQAQGLAASYAKRREPSLLRRGTKLNLSFDRRVPTYSGSHTISTTSIAKSIKQTWDMSFWTAWIDQQARNRYNVLSVWNHNPFPALVVVPGWEKATIPYVIGDGKEFTEDRSLTIEKRQQFWKDVMLYAKRRGFDFYFFDWNVTPEYAGVVYPQLKHEDIEVQATKDYYNSAIKVLLETYPDLAGFGVSPGDAMPKNAGRQAIARWIFDAYSKGIADYASANPTRKITFIHRLLKVDFHEVQANWKDFLVQHPNVTLDCSVKYCNAYTYSTTTPGWYKADLDAIKNQGASTWLTLRNDGFFYADFGDTRFVRDFLANLPPATHASGPSAGNVYLRGFYLGQDAYAPTRSYLMKDQELNRDPATGLAKLDIQRRWYMEMLWGRIAYDREISDEVFISALAQRYPTLPADRLFAAWAKASRGQARVVELVQGEWKLDSHFYTEFCMRRNDGENKFRTIEEFLNGDAEDHGTAPTSPAKGSDKWLASIKETAEGRAEKKVTSYQVADGLASDGLSAITLLAGMPSGEREADALLTALRSQAYLSLYYACKIRGATHLGAGKRDEARDDMAQAYGWWMHYVTAMAALYLPDNFRTYQFADVGWNHWNAAVLKEFHDLGGTGTPALPNLPDGHPQ